MGGLGGWQWELGFSLPRQGGGGVGGEGAIVREEYEFFVPLKNGEEMCMMKVQNPARGHSTSDLLIIISLV